MLSAPLGAFATSRLLVALVAMFAVLSFAPGQFPATPGTLHPFTGWAGGGPLDWVFSSLARWDAGHYLQIAKFGYDVGPDGEPSPRAAFFPLYPLLVRAVATPFGASEGAILISGVVVALGAFLAALVVLHRLVRLELGDRLAGRSVWLLALFPGSVYFSAPYSESVFLLTTVGAFYAARRDRWALAGLFAALASSSRLVGLAIVVPLAIMYLYGPRESAPAREGGGRLRPRFPLRRDVLWLALAPLGLVAFSAYLAVQVDDALAWSHVQASAFRRVNEVPLVTAWVGVTDAWHALGHLDRALGGHSPTGAAYNSDSAYAVTALLEVVLLAGGLAAIAGTFRRLPVAYGAYAVVALLMVLGSRLDSTGTIALQALHRYLAVIFPLFVWLAVAAERRGWWTPVVSAFGIGLGLFAAMFASRQWLI